MKDTSLNRAPLTFKPKNDGYITQQSRLISWKDQTTTIANVQYASLGMMSAIHTPFSNVKPSLRCHKNILVCINQEKHDFWCGKLSTTKAIQTYNR